MTDDLTTEQPGRSDIGIVLVAAGRGARAGKADSPKQYRLLAGKPVIRHTVEAFQTQVPNARITIIIHGDDRDICLDALQGFSADYQLVSGGATRQASVLAGLRSLAATDNPPEHVLIHDAARPFVDRQMLERIIAALPLGEENHGILPVLPVAETVKKLNNNGLVEQTISRDGLALAQTPQGFALTAILDIHERAAAEAPGHPFTDDASLYEWAGLPVRTVRGDRTNIKITYPEDFETALQTMNAAPAYPDIRTGNGYDVHVFGPGDHVMLCGVEIPHSRSLSGHSDADVGLHALTDALLATCGAGDIGDHFPPSDPQWKGAASSIFLAKAADIVREHGGIILNVDVSIVAEEPKIAPARLAMRNRLSSILNIDLERCSVKATTNERMGFVGRKEGIAALATASVIYGTTNDD